LPGADDLFFVAVVDFDVPSPEVVLQELSEGEVWVCADEIGRSAVKRAAVVGGAISKGPDDDELQRHVGTGFTPEHGDESFDLELACFPGGKSVDANPRDIRVLPQLLWSWREIAIEATPTHGFLVNRAKAQSCVEATACDESGCRRQIPDDGAVAVGAVGGDDQFSMAVFLLGINRFAKRLNESQAV
jgi:hypothetical protein